MLFMEKEPTREPRLFVLHREASDSVIMYSGVKSPFGPTLLRSDTLPHEMRRARDSWVEDRTQEEWSGLREQLSGYMDEESVREIEATAVLVHTFHDQRPREERLRRRKDGTAYTTHLLAVARILALEEADKVTVQSALAHDMLENTTVTKEEMQGLFGVEVTEIVEGVTKVTGERTKKKNKAKTTAKFYEAIADNPRVMLIKLADRLHNMRTIGFLGETAQQSVATETKDIIVPLANRYGMQDWAEELFLLSNQVLHQEDIADAQKRRETWIRHHLSPEKVSYLESIFSLVPRPLEIRPLDPFLSSFVQGDNGALRPTAPSAVSVVLVYPNDEFETALHAFETEYKLSKRNIMLHENGQLAEISFPVGGLNYLVRIRSKESDSQQEVSLANMYRHNREADENFGRKSALFQKRIENTRGVVLQYRKSRLSPEDFVEALTRLFQGHILTVYTPTREALFPPSGAGLYDIGFIIGKNIGYEAERFLVNGKSVKKTYKPRSGDVVEVVRNAYRRWQIEPVWLNRVHTPEGKAAVRAGLRLMLQAAGFLPSEKPVSYPYRTEILPYDEVLSEDIPEQVLLFGWPGKEFDQRMEKFDQMLREMGQDRIKAAFADKYKKRVRASLHRVWNARPDSTAVKRYLDFNRFLLEAGIESVDETALEQFAAEVAAYEAEHVHTLDEYRLSDRPGQSKIILEVLEYFKANLIRDTIEPNPPPSRRMPADEKSLPQAEAAVSIVFEIPTGVSVQNVKDEIERRLLASNETEKPS